MMAALRVRGCHFGDKCGLWRSARHVVGETGQMAPGAPGV